MLSNSAESDGQQMPKGGSICIKVGLVALVLIVMSVTMSNQRRSIVSKPWSLDPQGMERVERILAQPDINKGTIVNEQSYKNNWKFIVSIEAHDDAEAIVGSCTGSLIGPKKVLTAGHCCSDGTHLVIHELKADLGVTGTAVIFANYSYAGKAKEKEEGKQYSPIYDLCVITMDEAINLGDQDNHGIVYPSISGERPDAGSSVYTAGFGMYGKDSISVNLRSATLPVIDCADTAFDQKENQDDLILKKAQFICVDQNEQEQFGCQGDSGSPIYNQDHSVVYGVFVDTKKRPCEMPPGWYMDLSYTDADGGINFKEWVEGQRDAA